MYPGPTDSVPSAFLADAFQIDHLPASFVKITRSAVSSQPTCSELPFFFASARAWGVNPASSRVRAEIPAPAVAVSRPTERTEGGAPPHRVPPSISGKAPAASRPSPGVRAVGPR